MPATPPHILIAWELGQSYGHIARCLRLGRALMHRGARVTLALKTVALPQALRWDDPLQIIQAPRHAPARTSARPDNHASMLLSCGFDQPDDLAARLKAWLSMIKGLAIDLVVTDHAPTALLASRLASQPSVVLGNGFAVPPAQCPWPAFTPWHAVPESELMASETQLDARIAQALTALGWTGLAVSMRSVYDHALSLLDTFPELDQYPQRPDRPQQVYVGPITGLSQAQQARWSNAAGAKVLAYLHPHTAGLSELLHALAALPAEVHCVIPRQQGQAPATPPPRPGLHLHTQPLHLPELLPHTSLAITNGNSGVSTQCLLAGVPVLSHPRHVDQGLFAMAIERLGAGAVAPEGLSADAARQWLQQCLDDTHYRRQAQAFAQRHANHDPDEALSQTVSRILQALA